MEFDFGSKQLKQFNSLNRFVINYYDTLFALKTHNCLDNFTTIITALSNVFGLVRQFVFVLIQINVFWEITFDGGLCRVETSHLICIAMGLFDFHMARDITEENFRTFCGFLNVNLFAHLCFRLIELMSMVFFFYCCLITVQECAKVFRFKDAG